MIQTTPSMGVMCLPSLELMGTTWRLFSHECEELIGQMSATNLRINQIKDLPERTKVAENVCLGRNSQLQLNKIVRILRTRCGNHNSTQSQTGAT